MKVNERNKVKEDKKMLVYPNFYAIQKPGLTLNEDFESNEKKQHYSNYVNIEMQWKCKKSIRQWMDWRRC